jgi:hypothetical protein
MTACFALFPFHCICNIQQHLQVQQQFLSCWSTKQTWKLYRFFHYAHNPLPAAVIQVTPSGCTGLT